MRRGRRDLNGGDIQVQTNDTIDFIVTSKGYQAPNTLASMRASSNWRTTTDNCPGIPR